MNIEQILRLSPVIPVVTLHDVRHAVPLAETLLDAGIGVIEITLRTPAAPSAIEAVKRQVGAMRVGAGTIWTGEDLRRARDAGADFGVSPGATHALLVAVAAAKWPFLPGCQTASEIADRVERGHRAVKFFPAESAGGVPTLRAFSLVFPDILFCPTGGIGAQDAGRYRALPNVPTVGGSWITPADRIAAQDWSAIGRLARSAKQAAGG